MKILYIDEDVVYGKKLLDYLIEKSFTVKFVKNVKDGYAQNTIFEPDIIICDSTFNSTNSIKFIQNIKKKVSNTKVILLAKEATQNLLNLLFNTIDTKVDNVLMKDIPFIEIENLIRSFKIENITVKNRNNNKTNNLGEDYYYDDNSYSIIKAGQTIELTPQENILVKHLIKNINEYISNEELINIISINEGTTVQTLRTVIKKIRKKTYSEIIESKNRVGYRIKSKDEQTNNYIPKMEKHTLLSSKVLILKGNKNKNDTLKYNLEKYGLKCENAYTIKDAKIILEVEDYDYIVVDLDLPDGEGFDFIRDIENLNKTKVIMLSDSTDIHYKEYLYFKGILDYLVDIEDINLLAYNIYKTILKVDMNIKYNNILIIEKSKKICEQFKDILLPRNYNLTILHTTDNAYDIVETTDYSLIIIDLDIKDCYDFLSYVKTNINNSIPFIVLSDTQRNYDIVKEAYRNGASECLRKPIFAEEFILKVDQLVDNSKLLGDINEKLNFMRVYQHAVDQTTIVSKTDLEGKITYANDMFCNISKYNRDELIGQTHSILKHPDNNQDLYKEMWKTIKTDKKIWHGVVKNKAKDGSKYTVDTTIIPIIDSNKNIIEFISLRKADRIDYNIYHIK